MAQFQVLPQFVNRRNSLRDETDSCSTLSVGEKIRELNTALDALQRRLGRYPEDGWVAVELGVSLHVLHKIYGQAVMTACRRASWTQ
jgi:DNA-directed RNA polymerase specialized sigma subunit